MNCECLYVMKEQTINAAREFAKRISEIETNTGREIYPTYIAKITNDIYATSDYDGYMPRFKILKDTIVVFVGGKYHNMMELKPKGGKRAFPKLYPKSWFEDIEKCQ